MRSHYDALFLMVLCVLAGASGLISGDQSVVGQSLPTGMAYAYDGGLLIGGALSIAGLVRRRLMPEILGRVVLAGLMVGYAVMLLFVPTIPWYQITIMLFFGLVCALRVMNLRSNLLRITRELP